MGGGSIDGLQHRTDGVVDRGVGHRVDAAVGQQAEGEGQVGPDVVAHEVTAEHSGDPPDGEDLVCQGLDLVESEPSQATSQGPAGGVHLRHANHRSESARADGGAGPVVQVSEMFVHRTPGFTWELGQRKIEEIFW